MATLGIKRKELYGCPSEPGRDYENEVVFPCLDLQGAHVEAAGLAKLEFGEEVTLTVKARVCRVGGQSADDDTPSMAFDVMEIESSSAESKGGLAGAYMRAAK